MPERSTQWITELVEQVRHAIGLIEQLPKKERSIMLDALEDRTVYELAQRHGVTESYVWVVLNNAARLAHNWPNVVESSGLGSDTDPGVTGGYGDSGPGDLTSVPPFSVSEEESAPSEAQQEENPV
jgi:hypothetical protein